MSTPTPSITNSTLSLPGNINDHLRSKERSHDKQIALCSRSCEAIFSLRLPLWIWAKESPIINRSSYAPLAGNYYWIQNLITKIAFGQLFFSVQRASHPASPLPRSRPRPFDKKLCFHNVQPTKNVPNPLKLCKKVPKAIWASFFNNHPIIGQVNE